MNRTAISLLLFLSTTAFAQDVHFDYDRTANFSSYRSYQWADAKPLPPGDQLLDQDIKRAIDEQLVGKGMRRVETGSDLQIRYTGAVSKEKEFNAIGLGPRGLGGWGDMGRVTTSTIEVGMLVVEIFDPAAGRLVWRGSASKTLDIKRDPGKNYHNLEKAMAKLFKNYPPRRGN